jgi:UDP-glucose 4-epimerase
MRCVVTGGSGFIGFNLLRGLADSGRFAEIVSVDRRPAPEELDGAQHLRLELRDREALERCFEGTDVVYHLAAAANVDSTAASAVATVEENVAVTAMVLEAARRAKVRRFVLASTVWVYMGTPETRLTESTPIVPAAMNLYASTKLAAELVCRAYQQQFGLPCTILRFETPYGPHMRPELVVCRFLQQALRGDPITIAGDGRQTRNFIHVSDLVSGAVAAALRPAAAGQTYNLPGPDAVSIRELAEVVREVTGSASAIRFVDGRTYDSRGPEMSGALAESSLDWVPRIRIREGIQDAWTWLARPSNHGLSNIVGA